MNHFIHKSVFSLVIGLGCSSALAGTQIKFLNQTVTPEKSIATRSRAHVGVDDYVIQFKNAITESDKSSLRAAGISVFRYVPDDALIVRGTYEQLQTFAQNSRVNGFIPFKGAMKVSPALPPVSVFARVRALDAVIFTFTEADKNQIIDFIKKADPQTFFYDVAGKSISTKINQGLLHQVSEMTGVEYVQELVRMEPMHILLDDGQTPPPDDSQMKGDYTDLS